MNILKTGVILLCVTWGCVTQAATITKISNGLTGEANNVSINPSISGNGQFVVFESDASNLVENDNNGAADVFLFDTQSGTTERISVGLNNTEANGGSTNPAISADGRYITFESFASNLVNNDNNGAIDIFVYDRVSTLLSRVSISNTGLEATSHSFSPSISGDGRDVAFYSLASNLVTGDSNRSIDVFVHDTVSGTTDRVSVDAAGNQGNMDSWQPQISANGQFVTFASNASNLVSNDSNGIQDIFLFDRSNGTPQLVSMAGGNIASNGRSAYPAVNGDGSIVVFESNATNLVANDNNNSTDIFVFNRTQTSIAKVSNSSTGGDTDGPSYQPAVSENGRFIGFFTYATNLVTSDTNQYEDVYLFDQQTGNMELLTTSEDGQPADSSSYNPSINADGQYVALFSLASNFVTPDTNNYDDVFLFDRGSLNNPPVANAGDDANVILGERAALDGAGSFDPDGTPITAYQWQVVSAPAGSLQTDWTSTEATAVFLADVVGVYVLSLRVSDGELWSSADEVFVNVSNNLPPVAIISADVTEGYAPLVVSFDGSQSYDPESDAITWFWNFGDGSTSTEVNPTHTYMNPGSYLATLTVTDTLGHQGQADLLISVSAVNQPPEIVNLSVMPAQGLAPLHTTLSADVTDPEGDPVYITWDLGDGTVVTDVSSLTHVYTAPGDYHGVLTASDGVSSSQQSFVVSVSSDFHIHSTHYKIIVHHKKPNHSKFRFWSQFTFDGLPQDNDLISLTFGNIEIFAKQFDSFRQVKAGVYVYKSRKLMVKLDFAKQSLQVFKQRVYIDEDKFKPYAGVNLSFGDHTAVGEINLVKLNVCGKSKNDDLKDEHCAVSIYKNAPVKPKSD